MDKKVVIYTSNTCTYCDLAKEYFKENNIPYEEKNTSDPVFRKELLSIGVRSVPTIFVDDQYVVGLTKAPSKNSTTHRSRKENQKNRQPDG